MGRCTGWALALFALAGCAQNVALTLPDEPGARSYLVFLQQDGKLKASPGVPGERLVSQLLLDAGEQPLRVLYFAESADDLGLALGVAVDDAAPKGRPLPAPIASQVLSAPREQRWERIAGLDPALAEFRLPGFDPRACVDNGRCYGLEPADQDRCVECFIAPPPEEPIKPALPSFLPCPAQWRLSQSSSSSYALCLPLPNGIVDCPAGQMIRPSAPSCTTIGPACPSGDWPTPLPLGAELRYVGTNPPGAPPNRVYASVAAALAAAGPNDRLLLSKGAYTLDALPATAVVIEGSCVAGTTLTLGAGVQTASTALLRALTLSGGGVSAQSGARLVLSNVQLEGIRLSVDSGGTAIGQGWASRAASITVQGRLSLDGAVLRGPGPTASGAGAAITVRDSVLLSAGPEAGFVADDGASISLTQVWIEGSQTGVTLEHASNADLDLVILSKLAAGVHAQEGSSLQLSRVLLDAPLQVGIKSTQSTLNGSDLVVRADPAGDSLSAVLLDLDGTDCRPELGTASLSRVYVAGTGGDSFLTVCGQVQLDDYSANGSRASGYRHLGGEVMGERWRCEDCPGRGVVLEGLEFDGDPRSFPLKATLSDLSFVHMGDESFAVGVATDVTVERLNVFTGARNGMAMRGRDTHVRASEVEIEAIAGLDGHGACVLAAATDVPGGPHLHLELINFELEDSPYGVVINPRTEVTLRAGWLRNNDTAISLRSETIDPRALLHGVRFEANGSNGL